MKHTQQIKLFRRIWVPILAGTILGQALLIYQPNVIIPRPLLLGTRVKTRKIPVCSKFHGFFNPFPCNSSVVFLFYLFLILLVLVCIKSNNFSLSLFKQMLTKHMHFLPCCKISCYILSSYLSTVWHFNCCRKLWSILLEEMSTEVHESHDVVHVTRKLELLQAQHSQY